MQITNYTSVKHSQKLLELGLSSETADMYYPTDYYSRPMLIEDDYCCVPLELRVACWSTGQLLKIIENCVYVQLIHDGVMWNMTVQDHDKQDVKHHEMDDELIEICYKTMCWLLKNGYKWQE